jgi:hypothetical protein
MLTLGAAAAADGKHYPATFCQHHSNPDQPSESRMLTSQFGRIINDANRALTVVCPIIRDSLRGGGIDRVKVWGIHRNCPPSTPEFSECPGTNRCIFRVMTETGDTIRTTRTGNMVRIDEQTPQNTGNTRFIAVNFSDIDVRDFTNANALGTGSTYVLTCTISRDAELSSYYVGERTE